MNVKNILTLIALGTLSVSQGAAERECFDFGWKFKYMGACVPPEPAAGASAPV